MCHSCCALQPLRVNLCMVFVRSPISVSFVKVGLDFRLERLGYKSGVIVRWPWRRAAARIGHVCAAACRPKLIALLLECNSPCFLQRVPRPQDKAPGCFSRLRRSLHAGLEFPVGFGEVGVAVKISRGQLLQACIWQARYIRRRTHRDCADSVERVLLVVRRMAPQSVEANSYKLRIILAIAA